MYVVHRKPFFNISSNCEANALELPENLEDVGTSVFKALTICLRLIVATSSRLISIYQSQYAANKYSIYSNDSEALPSEFLGNILYQHPYIHLLLIYFYYQ